jgi:hypothetical protein
MSFLTIRLYDIAFIKLSTEGTGGIGTAPVQASFLFHTCLMTEEAAEVQELLEVAGLPTIINSTCLKKHHISIFFPIFVWV